jgi:hypothetical protein
MGRKRQDRTMAEWLNHGGILLNMMGKKHKLYKTTDATLSKLTSEHDDDNKQEATDLLNSYKDLLGNNWLEWVKKITQKPKDRNRSKFHIKNDIYDGILSFIGLNKETKKIRKISDKKVFTTLFQHFNSFGVNNTDEMYNLIDELNKFGSATPELHSKNAFTDKSKDYQGETNKIIHAILGELKINKINNFEELKDVNELLSDENKKLKRRIRELELELEPPLDID